MTATRHLWLARHGEATEDEHALSERGRRQAELLGERFSRVPLSAVHHGPLHRAAETARLVGGRLPGVPLHECEAAGDYLPHIPAPDELPFASADATLRRLAAFPAREREQGPALAGEALARFSGPVEGDEPRHELVITHNFLIGWMVRAALHAPTWRWIGLNHGNASLTLIRYEPDRPASLVLLNDMGHLPEDLRWTGFSAAARP
ncbi:histidine phosphatase family protein [Streptomyces sparsus]